MFTSIQLKQTNNSCTVESLKSITELQKQINSLKLYSPVAATYTAIGLVELATQDEVNLGLDANRVVTPLTLSTYIQGLDFSSSSSMWGTIGGNIANQIDLSSALSAKQNALQGTGIVKSTGGIISYIDDDSANWNLAYSWGDHSSVGYLTSETDPTIFAHIKNIPVGTSPDEFLHWNGTTYSPTSISYSQISSSPTFENGLSLQGSRVIWGGSDLTEDIDIKGSYLHSIYLSNMSSLYFDAWTASNGGSYYSVEKDFVETGLYTGTTNGYASNAAYWMSNQDPSVITIAEDGQIFDGAFHKWFVNTHESKFHYMQMAYNGFDFYVDPTFGAFRFRNVPTGISTDGVLTINDAFEMRKIPVSTLVGNATENNGSFIWNSTTLQASSNFNISDNGVIGKELKVQGAPATNAIWVGAPNGVAPMWRVVAGYDRYNTAYFQIGKNGSDTTANFRLTKMTSENGQIARFVIGATNTYAEGKLRVGSVVGLNTDLEAAIPHTLTLQGDAYISSLNDSTAVPKMVTTINGVLGYQNVPAGLLGLTTGRIPFATSSTTLGDDAGLAWDNTNKRATIGDGVNGNKLYINGGNASSTSGQLAIQNAGVSGLFIGTGSQAYLYTVNKDLLLWSNGVGNIALNAGSGRIVVNNDIMVKESITPSTPTSGYATIYPKSDGLWYGLDDTGVETKLSNEPVPTGFTGTVANPTSITVVNGVVTAVS